MMKLSDILSQVEIEQILGDTNVTVTGVAHDSRKVLPGQIFVAVPGLKADGARFARQAVAGGAIAVVQETALDASIGAPVLIRVPHARRAMARLARAFHGYPDSALKMLGITGTNGKTTTAFIVKHLLEKADYKSGLVGTVLYDDGEREIPAARTTPESVELYDLLARMKRAGCRASVMEVSSHALDQGRVEGIDFDVAVFTNLTQDHLDYHKTIEAYFDAKSLLFQKLGTGVKQATAVVNLDDPRATALMARVNPAARIQTYGFHPQADLRAHPLELGSRTTRYNLHYQGVVYPVVLPLAGRHNVSNSLAALGTVLALGLDLSKAVDTLAGIPPVPGRLERVHTALPFDIFVDYAHTDDALHNVLMTLRETTRGRLITVFGCGGNRDAQKRELMGQVAARLSDYSVLTSDNPRSEDPMQIISQIARGFENKTNYEIIEDRREAIYRALHLAQKADTVLVAGKGHETYQEFAAGVVPFDDREVVRELATELNRAKGGSWIH